MDAEDLDYRTRTESGCIPPRFVERLVELGHTDEVERQAGRGEWFCALDRARYLAGQDRQAEALAVLDPFVATGWWTAAESAAALLEGWGRVAEAIALTLPYAEDGKSFAVEWVGRLLARHGRADEAFDLLHPHVREGFVAAALVDACPHRAEEVAALLVARIEAAPVPECQCGRGCVRWRRTEPWNAGALLATIRERQGRVDEAIALLDGMESTAVNDHDLLADLLARHDRFENLRAYAATDILGFGARRLAEVLEGRGDVDGAIAVYRQPAEALICSLHEPLARLLMRHGRVEEATAVLREWAGAPGGTEDYVADTLCTHYADLGRPEDGLAFLDALPMHYSDDDWAFFCIRQSLLTACGRREEAYERARAQVDAGAWHAARTLADLLAEDGRTEEAVAVLEQQGPDLSADLAWHLIGAGRVPEAVALLQRPQPRFVAPPADGPIDEPPF
ncbi:hypothetical protein ACFPIJ_34880 [Dactylosporangium cerinum]|uniref:Tetratricopeptide repeat protein n=1 Tax=Dactylosporangium cerinum TaxID=1434730 RepID=A0ABV9W6Q1_9ACTN